MPNIANFKEPEADAKQKEILAMPADKVPAAWGEFDKYIAETYFPEFVTSYDGVVWGHGSNVNGVSSDLVFGMPTWKNVWLSNQ